MERLSTKSWGTYIASYLQLRPIDCEQGQLYFQQGSLLELIHNRYAKVFAKLLLLRVLKLDRL